MIQIHGEETFMYPSDGGVVSAQSIHYENGEFTHTCIICIQADSQPASRPPPLINFVLF